MESRQEFLDIKDLLEKNNIPFVVGDSDHEDYFVISDILTEEFKPVVLMTNNFYIVGLENLRKRINQVQRFILDGSEFSSDDVVEEESSNYNETGNEVVKESGAMNNFIAGVISFAKNAISYNKNKEPDDTKGEMIHALLINPFGIKYHRLLILTENFIIRIVPSTKERRSIRSYADLVEVNVNRKYVKIVYIDGVEYYYMNEEAINRLLDILQQHKSSLKIVRN